MTADTPVPVSADAAPETCHCGKPIYTHEDGFTRGLCQECDTWRKIADRYATLGISADPIGLRTDIAALLNDCRALESERSVLAAKIQAVEAERDALRSAILTILPWLDQEATNLLRWGPDEGPASAAWVLRAALAATEETK